MWEGCGGGKTNSSINVKHCVLLDSTPNLWLMSGTTMPKLILPGKCDPSTSITCTSLGFTQTKLWSHLSVLWLYGPVFRAMKQTDWAVSEPPEYLILFSFLKCSYQHWHLLNYPEIWIEETQGTCILTHLFCPCCHGMFASLNCTHLYKSEKGAAGTVVNYFHVNLMYLVYKSDHWFSHNKCNLQVKLHLKYQSSPC